jgi:GNAT superfamily N-acetyltransferase
LYIDEFKFFSRHRNPAFAHCSTILLLAWENGQPVGRIMGITPHEYNRKHQLKTARFAYFECYKQKEIFLALLGAIEEWAGNQGCLQLIGPMGFSDKEPQGFVTAGFDQPAMLVTNCSFPFMKDYVLQKGYDPYVEFCQYELPLSASVVGRFQPFMQRIKNAQKVSVHGFQSVRKIRKFIRPVFQLINETYQEIYGFTPVTEAEMKEFANRFLPLLNPRLIKIITDLENQVVAFIIAMPDLSPGIRKAGGRLLPFGWWHIYRSSRQSGRLVLLLGAVKQNMQGKGLDAVLATHLIHSALELGFTVLDSHLIMRTNHKMRGEIERLEGYNMYKEYTIYSKNLQQDSEAEKQGEN